MQSDLHNRDFEQYLKQTADQYRMFPSEKVWQGIDNALHTRRRWYGLGLTFLLLLTGAAVTFVMLKMPSKQNEPVADILLSPDDAFRPEKKNVFVADNSPAAADRQVNPQFLEPLIGASVTSPFPAPLVIAEKDEVIIPAEKQNIVPGSIAVQQPQALVLETIPSKNIVLAETKTISSPAEIATSVNDNSFEEIQSLPQKDIVSLPRYSGDIYPLTIESVVNSFRLAGKKKNFTLQFHISPTISYRKLSENKTFLQNAAANGTIPGYAAYSDVNNYVNHKPDMGLELGFTGRYALSNSLRLRAGINFNVSRYDIRAYDSQTEVATIALDAGGSGRSSITRITNYRNFSGGDANWLKNLYYSASLPVGAEFLFKSKTNTRFGVAATIQPTYIIRNRAFLITTDYKNYIEEPSLVRRWNMNTSFETFANIPIGGAIFQVGPQVRYQLNSSFVDKYPVKENLFDFGFKVGIQLNQ